MKICYIPPKAKKKKKDVVLFSLTQQAFASLFVLDDPEVVIIIIFLLLLSGIYAYLKIQQHKKEVAKKQEDDFIKNFDRNEKLKKIAEAAKDKSCKNVKVNNLF